MVYIYIIKDQVIFSPHLNLIHLMQNYGNSLLLGSLLKNIWVNNDYPHEFCKIIQSFLK